MNLLRDTQLERLFFIEYLAIFAGQISRKDLVGRFGISQPAATKDLTLYSELSPDVLRYDLRQKCYVLNEPKPYFEHNVEQALYSLAGDRTIGVDPANVKRLTSWVNSNIRRQLPLETASAITRSINLGRTIEAEYLSLSSGMKTRKLSPVALVNDGLRWHARCYDHEKSDFRDFSFTRFSRVQIQDRSSVTIQEDSDWMMEVELELVPHPKATHPETIRVDFDIGDNPKRVQLKRCLVGYFLKHWHIDSTDDASGNPNAQQLYLKNKAVLVGQKIPSWAFK
ncbi:MAG: hypothetical protein A3K04_02975 [Gallionellales bacterium RBG_16_56_9]|nr:MAG: hypothetical protein A3K04_02975 [Gallionellales bacterium RBG_16_56_9]